MAAEPEEQDYLILDTHDVALGNRGEEDFNTIVLSGIDVVIPLELDVDGDPLQDDVVRLRSEHGHFSQTLHARHDDVVPDEETGLLLYHFHHVPPGMYSVAVKVGKSWSPLLSGLVVTKEGAFVGKNKLGEATTKDHHPAEEAHSDPDDEALAPPDDPCEH